jgi:hypothetical protein
MSYAGELVDRLPATLALLSAGRISPAKVRLLCHATLDLPDPEASAVETKVLERAEAQTRTQFRRALTRAVNVIAPKVAERRRTQAVEDRQVRIQPSESGMCSIYAELPADQALRVDAALNHYADTHYRAEHAQGEIHDDQHRAYVRKQQLRADALVALADGYLANPARFVRPDLADYAPPANRVKVRPQIQVTVALSTLIGVDDNPADLAGYGPIPASLARLMAQDPDSTWRRLVTDPLGRLVDYGTEKYKPPAALDRFVRAKHRLCAYPTCSRTALICELDHFRARKDRGPTNERNLISLCARHHHLKHEAGWSIKHNPTTGVTTWTTPTGRVYTNTADPLPISHDLGPVGDPWPDDTQMTDAELDHYARIHDYYAGGNDRWDEELEHAGAG